jgi:chitooligosaccharide deacetylase
MPVQGTERAVYLTFDDGPNPTVTPELLDLLKEKNVRATFLLIDNHLNEATAPIVRRMFDEGHAVGLHTNRRWLSLRSPSHVEAMLRAAADRIHRLTGQRPCRVFRPHAGWRSVSMFGGVRRAGYRLIGWSWMSHDWVGLRKRTARRVAAQLISHASPGQIMIIHDGDDQDARADRRYAIEATRRIVDELQARGFEFRPVCNP